MKLYTVNVSMLNVRNKPSSDNHGVGLKRGTIVKLIGPPATYKSEQWIHVETIDKPIVNGWINGKYVNKLN